MNDIITWVKIGEHFINQDNVRALIRQGSATRIERIIGHDIVVEIDYDKAKKLFPSNAMNNQD